MHIVAIANGKVLQSQSFSNGAEKSSIVSAFEKDFENIENVIIKEVDEEELDSLM